MNIVYNKWHETELERWLSDHDVPYPSPADRKDLESLIEKNWDAYVVSPYNSWDTNQLNAYLQSKGKETKNEAAASKDSLLSQVKANWYETESNAHSAWLNVKDWILDTWTESQLKAFADKHGIPGKCAPSDIVRPFWPHIANCDIQPLSPASVTLFSRRLALTTRRLPRRRTRLLLTLETGFTRHGLNRISRSGLTPTASLPLSL